MSSFTFGGLPGLQKPQVMDPFNIFNSLVFQRFETSLHLPQVGDQPYHRIHARRRLVSVHATVRCPRRSTLLDL